MYLRDFSETYRATPPRISSWHLAGLGQGVLACQSNDKLGFWDDLINFRPSRLIQSSLAVRGFGPVQRVEEDGWGDINLDFYAVNVKRLPILARRRASPEDFLSFIRLSINRFIDTSLADFAAYDANEAKVWKSNNPLGAVLIINISPANDGSVVTSLFTPSFWMFTTIKTPYKGGRWHPVSGNRQFGFIKHPDGNYYFFTKGSDRATRGWGGVWPGLIFDGAHKLWLSFQDRLAGFVNNNGGEAKILPAYSCRHKWAEVRRLYHRPSEKWWKCKQSDGLWHCQGEQ